MVRKIALVILVIYFAVWGLNKVAGETRRITASAPGSVLVVKLSNETLQLTTMGKGYQIVFPPVAARQLAMFADATTSYYSYGADYLRITVDRINNVIDHYGEQLLR